MATHKPFREVVRPGSNFEFVGKTRTWVLISVVGILASIAILFVNRAVRGDYMNWSTDFKGGTEMVFAFHDAKTGALEPVGAGKVRGALKKGGFGNFGVSSFTWHETGKNGQSIAVHGMLVRTRDFGAVSKKRQSQITNDFYKDFKDRNVLKVDWSGDRMFARTTKPVTEAEAKAFFQKEGLSMKDWTAKAKQQYDTPEAGTGQYNFQFAIHGIDRQYQKALDAGLKGIDARVVNVYGVGAKAGAKLRNDGIKSLFYAMGLIMLYLVFRFDVRYAPGAVIALLHDATLVVGVFALTWTQVSLTTVAAILTVIGYSVNDTVVVFDRIRENAVRLKDKKLPRIMNISINETLSRTLLTSGTTFAVTLMMNIFGNGLVRNFAFAMNIGIVVGTYSSIFIASPIVLVIHNRWFAAGSKRGARGGAKKA